MKTALIAIFAIAITMGFAYADSYEDTVRFDLFANSTVSERACYFEETESNGLDYKCQWHISTHNATQFVEEMLDAFEETIEELEEEQGITEEISDTPETPKTNTEKLIEKLKHDEDIGKLSTADKELLRLLEATKRACELGIEHGSRIQQYAVFELPSIDPRIDTAVDFLKNHQLGQIIKKFEECKGWNEYRYDVLGQRYLDIIVDDSTTQGFHRDVAENMETYPHPKLTEHDFIEEEKKSRQSMCDSHLYPVGFKRELGCFETVVLPVGPGIEIKDNPSYKAYTEYMSSGGTAVDLSTLKQQEVDKANAQSLESFALQHGIDLADLKNLVQNVDEYNEAQKP